MNSILITGASRGIGRSIAVQAARSGLYNRIIVNCIKNESMLMSVRDEVQDILDNLPTDHFNGEETLCLMSVGDTGDISYVETLHKEVGSVNVLINNASISITGLFTDMTPEQWDRIIRTNLTSVYNTCHTFVPDMINDKKGRILNISSVWGLVGASCEVGYSAAKGACNAFTKALAKELAPSNIQVNALALSIVDTEMNSNLTKEDLDNIKEDIPSGYIMTPDEAADAALKLLNMPEYFTGEVVKLDGAWI